MVEHIIHFSWFDALKYIYIPIELQNLNQLCRRFTKFVTMYDLMPKDNLIVPVDSLESGLSSNSSSGTTTDASNEKEVS